MIVFWLEQAAADVPPDDGWLSAGESERITGMRVPKRRADWRLGRWTAKRAVAAYLDLPGDAGALAEIGIRAAPDGAPEAFLRDRPAGASISITHSAGRAVCAVGPPEIAIGCDLEKVEARSLTFLLDYFTGSEQQMVERAAAGEQASAATLVWCAKESALKALRTGLRRDTQSVVVSRREGGVQNGWRALSVQDVEGRAFAGWWREQAGFVLTVVSDPAAGPPVRLGASGNPGSPEAPLSYL